MKFIVIGLGNFGASLALQLVGNGHEVIGIDNREVKVEEYKDGMTATICLNSVEESALRSLPLNDVDAVIVAIGEDLGASVQTLALLKKLGVKQIIARALSPLHETIVEAIGVSDILHPERDAALATAVSLESPDIVGQYAVADNFSLMEIKLPHLFVGQTVDHIGFKNNFNLTLIGIKRYAEKRNIIGAIKRVHTLIDDFGPATLLSANDIVVLYGRNADFKHFFQVGTHN